tara:strand:- start:5282 stop:7900 length:2619 start_codon:yes stop_codon:yes gene_type:complete
MRELIVHRFLQLVFILSITNFLIAVEVSGIITDQDGRSLPGANIMIEGTAVGSASDSEGRFSFTYEAQGDFVIVVSYIGYSSYRQVYSISEGATDLTIVLDQGKLFGQEVTVMARKKEETIKEVPISMVAMRKETIEDMGATSIEDLTAMVPNVFNREDPDVDNFNIRGIEGGARNPGMGTTEGIYLDGIVMGRPDFVVLDVADMESVEFLRGPQGTLFGRNTISGAINLITVKPKPGFSGSVLVENGNSGHRKIKASTNFQLSKNIYHRLSFFSFDLDAHQINTSEFARSDDIYKDNLGVHYAIRALPIPKLTIDLSYDYFSQYNTQMGNHVFDWHFSSDVPNYNGQRLDSLALELYKVYPEDMPYLADSNGDISDDGNTSYNHDISGWNKRLVRSASLNTVYQIKSNMNLVGLFGYRDGSHRYFNDEDGIGLNLLTGNWTDIGEQKSAELRLESMSDNLSWVAGVYYYHMHESLDSPVFPKPLFFHIRAGIPMFLARQYDGVTVHPFGSGTTESIGAYVSGDYKVSDQLMITGGVRYSEDDKEFTYRQDGLPTFGYIHFPADNDGDNLPDGHFDSTASWSALTPSFSIKYAATSLTNVYGTISKGYKSGGFNLDYVSSWESVAIPFKPEFITNYEFGIKTANLRNTMYLNTAFFYMDYINMQRAIFQDLYEGYTISNAASSLVKGIETEVSVRLFQNALTLVGGFGIIDAKFNEFRDSFFNGYWNEGEDFVDANNNGQYDDGETWTDMDNDFSGETISAFPEYTWNFLADFRFPLNNKMMFVSQLQVDFMDEKQSQLSSTNEFNELRDDARTLIDARVGVEIGPWSVFAWVQNIFDIEYISWTGQNSYIGVLEQDYGLPRRLGLRASYRF